MFDLRAGPGSELARSSSMPLMVLTASSIRLVIWVSTSSALAPGSWTCTLTIGESVFGIRSRPRSLYENAPEHDERRRHHDGEDRTLDADVCQFHWPAPSPPAATALAAAAAGLRAAALSSPPRRSHARAGRELIHVARGERSRCP